MRNNCMAKRPEDRQVSDRQKAGSYRNLLHLCADLLEFNICSLYAGNVSQEAVGNLIRMEKESSGAGSQADMCVPY